MLALIWDLLIWIMFSNCLSLVWFYFHECALWTEPWTLSSSFPCSSSPCTFCQHRLWVCIDQITGGSDFNWFFRTVLEHRESIFCWTEADADWLKHRLTVWDQEKQCRAGKWNGIWRSAKQLCNGSCSCSGFKYEYLGMKQPCMLKWLERYQDNSLQEHVTARNEAIVSV